MRDGLSTAILAKGLTDGAWRDRVNASDGLCLRHLRLALGESDRGDAVEWLLADHERRLDALLMRLRQYIANHDARVPKQATEADDVHLRALATIAGSWFSSLETRHRGIDAARPGELHRREDARR